MITKLIYSLVIVACLTSVALTKDECSASEQQFLITFHPHLDAFWLNTDDQLKDINFHPAGFLYAMNQRNSKQIFNSMLQALEKDPKRKYFITQIVFFKDWYYYISDEKRIVVKKLLTQGQLDVANSGWVQNDQAVCYYDDVIDQYTIGMNWMYQEFGYVNKIGWATDSFGHSHSQVALQHLLGFQFQGIQRIDDRYIYQRKEHPLLEFYWQPVSDSNGKKYGGVLNHVRHFLHEVNDLRGSYPNQVSKEFREVEKNMKTLYGKNKLFRFLGNDFEQFTTIEFENLEKAMIDLNGGDNKKCNTFKYGNPKDYLELIKPYWTQKKPQTRHFDFISNWDQDRYWSGYFTTDPQLKIICKEFSRLVNLARKRMIKQFVSAKNISASHVSILQKAEQLLSVMQHHDGITATSKAHIQTLFKDRMKKSSVQLIQMIKKIQKLQSTIVCQLYKNNQCKIQVKQQLLTLSILHQGSPKTQQIHLSLPQNYIYEVQNINSILSKSTPNSSLNTIRFKALLNPGLNHFVLKGTENKEKLKETQWQGFKKQFDHQGIKLQLEDNKIVYKFADNFMKFTFQTSQNSASSRQTVAWNKYGSRQDKTEHVGPGIYIMSNNGQLKQINPKFQTINALDLGEHIQFSIKGEKITVQILIQKLNPSQIEYSFSFQPLDHSMADYFLRIQSNIINGEQQFYHDSNGYLVSRRKTGYRPDYQWIYKQQDKINANTYPACSFLYVYQNNKKFVIFLDRALGVSTYDGSLLVNIDRLAMDDYKGVGEGYGFIRQNNFRFKLGITAAQDDLERIWQRQYDDANVGFISNTQFDKKVDNLRHAPDQITQYLKYTVSYLNNKQVLLRIHNLAERKDLKLAKFSAKQWILQQLGLQLKYEQIRESFANGLLLNQRFSWLSDPQQINTHNRNSSDNTITLKPLQIRSFRINLKQKIIDRQVYAKGVKPANLVVDQVDQPIVQTINQSVDVKSNVSLIKHSLRKRCY